MLVIKLPSVLNEKSDFFFQKLFAATLTNFMLELKLKLKSHLKAHKCNYLILEKTQKAK